MNEFFFPSGSLQTRASIPLWRQARRIAFSVSCAVHSLSILNMIIGVLSISGKTGGDSTGMALEARDH